MKNIQAILSAINWQTVTEQMNAKGYSIIPQQTPRAQSKAIVLTPGKGDILLFTTNFRPIKGSKVIIGQM
jgi:hypothetical protein